MFLRQFVCWKSSDKVYRSRRMRSKRKSTFSLHEKKKFFKQILYIFILFYRPNSLASLRLDLNLLWERRRIFKCQSMSFKTKRKNFFVPSLSKLIFEVMLLTAFILDWWIDGWDFLSLDYFIIESPNHNHKKKNIFRWVPKCPKPRDNYIFLSGKFCVDF